MFGVSSVIGAEMFRAKRSGHINGHSEKEEEEDKAQQRTIVNNTVENTIGASTTTTISNNNNNATTTIIEESSSYQHVVKSSQQLHYRLSGVARLLLILILTMVSKFTYKHIIQKNIHLLKFKLPSKSSKSSDSGGDGDGEGEDKGKDENAPPPIYPEFVFDHPYVTSSYYISTSNTKILEKMYEMQVEPKKDRLPDRERGIVSRLAILRPFCEVSIVGLDRDKMVKYL